MNSNLTTFWRFLSDHIVEIPIIQRDYAQGRQGKEELRKTFLKDLKHALDSGEPLKLDFVYGAAERGAFTPLDGQQRLTTLWLLHWYLAYMAGKMDEGVRQVLAKFTYETRTSSREFCKRLSGFFECPSAEGGVVDHIQNQTWFRSAWKQDPTIQSMLRMLGGTSCQGKDGIEGAFESIDGVSAYEKYWEKLSGVSCPIEFYALDIHGINQTDDLYIKMNARGKPLTSFENLKADLAGYIQNKAKTTTVSVKTTVSTEWKNLDKKDDGFAIKMDTDWMDIFWKNRSPDSAVDEIYFAFLIRYFFNAYALQLNKLGDLQKGDDPIFDYLYGRNAISDEENERIVYLGFDEVFKKVLDGDDMLLERLYVTLDNFSRFLCDFGNGKEVCFDAPWSVGKDDKSYFVPRYINHETLSDFAGNRIRKIDRITQPRRVIFHAICRFFEKGWTKEDGLALHDWMRVVWNIVENANVDTIPGMIGCLKLIDELGSHSHNILEWLNCPEKSLESKFANDQVSEEIEKAKQIFSDATGAWKIKIEDAEKTAFFNGAIRFLYKDGNGDVDWNFFDTKLRNAKKFFDKGGVGNEYRKNALLLRAFLASEQIRAESGFWFGHGKEFWRNSVLLDASFSKTTDELLKSTALPVSDKAAEWIKDANLIADAINGDAGSPDGTWHILSGWKHDGDRTLTRYTKRVAGNVNYPHQIIPISGFANNSLQTKRQTCLTGEMIASSPQRRGSKWLIGWESDIEFQYGGHWFRWLGAPNRGRGEYDIYLLKDNWKNEEDPYMGHGEDITKKGDQKLYCCFNVDATENSETFVRKLCNQVVALI